MNFILYISVFFSVYCTTWPFIYFTEVFAFLNIQGLVPNVYAQKMKLCIKGFETADLVTFTEEIFN